MFFILFSLSLSLSLSVCLSLFLCPATLEIICEREKKRKKNEEGMRHGKSLMPRVRNNTYTYGTILTLTEQYLHVRNNHTLTEQYIHLRNNTYTYGTHTVDARWQEEQRRQRALDRCVYTYGTMLILTEQYLYTQEEQRRQRALDRCVFI